APLICVKDVRAKSSYLSLQVARSARLTTDWKGNGMQLFGEALGLGTIGLLAGVVGAVIAALVTRKQTSTFTSYVQHFAAGLIIAAATLDLLRRHCTWVAAGR